MHSFRLFQNVYHCANEMLFAYICLHLIKLGVPIELDHFLLFAGLSILVLTWSYEKGKMYVIVATVFLIIIGLIVFSTIIDPSLIVVGVLWRTGSHYKHFDMMSHPGTVVVWSVILGSLLYWLMFVADKPGAYKILAVLFIQIGLVIIIEFAKKILFSHLQTKEKVKVSSIFTLFLITLLSITALASVSYLLIPKVVMGLLGMIGQAVGFLLSPFLMWLINYFEERGADPFKPVQTDISGEWEHLPLENVASTVSASFNWFISLAVIITLVIVVLLLWRRFKTEKAFHVNRNEGMLSQVMPLQVTKINNRTNMYRGNNEIRKSMYQFELYCKKKELNRLEGETVIEWFKRIEAPDVVKGDILYIYEKARYGEEIKEGEVHRFKTSIKLIKTHIKKKRK
ncbi:hypothetical protein EJF36_07560 [Bacillus sp. HMF5848]|uniref:hypothetical protein n=1 Tax=Bacillus sp. HMF5848 TaxID=2495421 RepID=UPI000F7AD731|nr:hypothetical protein [Bacillus sp. HMF5848]RSK26728.1 hypothetical protein EJF36_07560 [Bacillus sp. HMF5848]